MFLRENTKPSTGTKQLGCQQPPLPVLHFIITIKLEQYRLLLCPAVKLIFYSLATTPEPLLFIRHMNSPEGCFGAHASLWGELGTTAHETVIKTHLLEGWHRATPLELKHVLCICVFLCKGLHTWEFSWQYLWVVFPLLVLTVIFMFF